MKINQDKIENPAELPIESVEVVNDNNFSFRFYNYGGYIHEVNIPYHNKEEITEDVLLGYGDIDGVLNSHGYFNSFFRHPNKDKIKGLYNVGGTSHPGGGTPTVLKSSKITSDLIKDDY